ncbi:hypothetical protein AYO43_08600 [Nitrospira sp. SCGC AG-212-E16]|nr:hypothetical protein AYO43_08600 [Nitrospira sp. SCGC AG-212-E16]
MAHAVALKSKGIEYHIAEIQKAHNRVRESFFEFIWSMKVAKDDLGQDILGKELASVLAISPASLSRYLAIADCAPLMRRQKSLPPVLNTLYTLTQLHDLFRKAYGENGGLGKFNRVLQGVDKNTEADDLVSFVQEAKKRIASNAKKERERGLLDISGGQIASGDDGSALKPWKELIEGKDRFRTVFMNPDDRVLELINETSTSVNDVHDKYKIADLRTPSQTKTVQGFVYCSSEFIPAGRKLLEAAGFNYRDMFVPTTGTEGFEHIRREKVLLRGERGADQHVTLKVTEEIEPGEAGARSIAVVLGSEPRLYVFASEPIENWTCSNPDRS